jgi:hypothetical protein
VALLGIEATLLIIILFISCMVSLIIGPVVFIVDVNMSLSALQLEIDVEKHDKT